MPVAVSVSPLRDHVLSVVFLAPKEEVVRVHAPAVIASMQNAHTVRDFTSEQHPG
jgi:hypothetical protein